MNMYFIITYIKWLSVSNLHSDTLLKEESVW